jgi:radical SAM protein with 4Fe4S-binding SPASM domain
MKKLNLLKAGVDNFFPRTSCLSQPTAMMIEPTDLCNLRCTGCWTNDDSRGGRPRYLSTDGFKKVIDDLGDNLFIIWLWGWGEPFLNKNIYEMTRLARRKDIVVLSSTNGNVRFDAHEAEELLRSGLSQLIVAVDGTDQVTYGKYRTGGRLDLILDNIRTLVETKRRLALPTPVINMRMVVMRHNQDQIAKFRALGGSLGVDIVSFKTMCDYRKEGVNEDFPTIERYQRYAMDEETRRALDASQRYFCDRPWRRIHVFADGAVTPCEFDLKREHLLGRVYEGGSSRAQWNNPAARGFRRRFLADIDQISFCSNCPYRYQVVWDPTVEWHHLTEAART